MMTGVVKVGTATGQMVLPLLAALLMAVVGWRYAALALGYAGAALLLIARVLDAVSAEEPLVRPACRQPRPGACECPAQPCVLDLVRGPSSCSFRRW